MAITAQDVNKLRQMTGAGMMDCKKALVEADGDFDKAVEILRKKGQKISASRSDRETNEGSVFVKSSDDLKEAVLISLNCETDFVGKNEEFQQAGNSILEVAFKEKPASIEELKKLKLGDLTIEEKLTELVGKIGEKIDIGAYERLSGDMVVSYIHSGSRLGVLVALANVGGDAEEAGRDIGMQIAAMNPVALDKDQVDQSTIDRELEIGREQARAEGKPDNIIDKIAEGKLNKFYKDNTLVNQAYVKEPSMSVAQYLDSVNKGMKVIAFKRVSVSE
ncbi:translation elongation factor Ts [Catalinimonas niigatensis]|uniref:translation elongation factor Ts n=1 Tax=Catalinimonas niigatensis TaxID=1397264 RepID=UPI002667066D|nr:translation elongation factor Ts [Catalinimonas niigatensis]WPP49033.1 translation elongation factor Ts [Catalinimonas niigatensis]